MLPVAAHVPPVKSVTVIWAAVPVVSANVISLAVMLVAHLFLRARAATVIWLAPLVASLSVISLVAVLLHLLA